MYSTSYTRNQIERRKFDDQEFCPDIERLVWANSFDNSANTQYPRLLEATSRHEYNCRVAIVLGHYNGEAYLHEQIQSILNQSHRNFDLFLTDDCSNNGVNLNELELAPIDSKKIRVGCRPSNVGFSNNFLGALSNIDESFKYFAFSDQDDIWHGDKVKKALHAIAQYPDDVPALYCARTAITNETCELDLGISPLFDKPPSFANALVQNIGGGNTMVFNKAARDLIVASSASNTEVVSHDWWCYQIISGAGGVVVYDPEPCLKYRQHANNLVGTNMSWPARLIRIRGLLKGKFRNWNDINLSALIKNKALLTADNQRCLDDFIEARKSKLIKRFFLFKRTGIYRQTLFGNIGLLLGILINKV